MKQRKLLKKVVSMFLAAALLIPTTNVGVVEAASEDTRQEKTATPGYWVLDKNQADASITEKDGRLVLSNGIVERTIDLKQNAVTTSFKNLYKDWELLSGTKAEAIVGLDGTKYSVGGNDKNAFVYESYKVFDETEKHIEWTPKKYITKLNPWPAIGKAVEITYKAPEGIDPKYADVRVVVRIEIFKGISVIDKKATVMTGDNGVKVTYFACDQLQVAPEHKDDIWLESNYNGGNGNNGKRSLSYQWDKNTVTTRYDMGPDWNVEPNSSFDSFRIYELLHSTEYSESKLMEVKNMYQIIAPWTNENPLIFSLISDDSNAIRRAADNCADIGFDMVVQTFGTPGLDLESTDPAYLARKKADYDYVHSKGIEIGGYTLAIVKDYGPVRAPWAMDGDPNSIYRCLATDWSKQYWNNIKNYIKTTGADMIEIDGPYHFINCNVGDKSDEIKAEHNHAGLSDSRYAQWKESTLDMMSWMKENDIFVNAPDWLFLNGSNKSGIGYIEKGYSNPRQEQLILTRMYSYAGTYATQSSMGWTHLPIEQYHGGGSAATYEPLNKNLKDYEWFIAESVASGVFPGFRGSRLYDTEETKNIVKYWVDLYKKYADLLNSNTVHFMMPQMDPNNYSRTLGIDGIMQADANREGEKGFMMLFNQTDTARTEKITVPMYYTGLTNLTEPPQPVPGSHPSNITNPDGFMSYANPVMRENDDTSAAYPEAVPTDKKAAFYVEGKLDTKQEYTIDSNGNVEFYVTIPPMSYTWFTVADTEAELDEPIPYPGKSADIILPPEEEKEEDWIPFSAMTPPTKWDIQDNLYSVTTTTRDERLIRGNTASESGTVEAEFKIEGKANPGIVFNASSKGQELADIQKATQILVQFMGTPDCKITATKSGVPGSIGEKKVTINSGEWHKLKVDYAPEKATIYFDGEKLFDCSDSQIKTGDHVGFLVSGSQENTGTVSYRNFKFSAGNEEVSDFDPGSAQLVDDADQDVIYTGDGWVNDVDRASINGTLSHTATKGDKATVKFAGSEISFYSKRSYNAGDADLYLDGEYVGRLPLKQSKTESRALAWRMENLENAPHTLEIVNVNGELPVDGFLITDKYNRAELKLKSGDGKEAEIYSGFSVGYVLTFGDPSIKIDKIEFIPSEENVFTFDTGKKEICANADIKEEKTVTVYAKITAGDRTLGTNKVTLTVKPLGDSAWFSFYHVPWGQWTREGAWPEKDGVYKAGAVSDAGEWKQTERLMLHKAYAMSEGTVEFEFKNQPGAGAGVSLNSSDTMDENTLPVIQQAIHVVVRKGEAYIERSGRTEGFYDRAKVDAPDGQWNKMKVVFTNGRIQIYVNDKKAVDCKHSELETGDFAALYVNLPGRENSYSEFRNVKFSTDAEMRVASDVSVTTTAGIAPVMPEAVTVNDGSMTWDLPVTWEAIDPKQYASEGNFTVNGIVDGTTIQTKAYVTVEANNIDDIFKITVNGETKEYQYNDKVTITAPEKEGYKFAGWKVNGKIVSYEEAYTFYVTGNMKFVPTYVEEAETVNKEAQAMLSNVFAAKRADDKTDVTFVGELVIPEGYELVNAGLIWSSKEGTELTVDGGLNPNLRPTFIKKISDTNQFSVTIKGMPQGKFIRGSIFATVTNGTETKVIASAEGRVTAK